MLNSELYKFACKCLLLDKNSQFEIEVKNKFKSGQIDLERFVLLCSNHLVLPAIYFRLNNAGLFEYFPLDFELHLKEIYHLNKKRNNEILLQIEELSNVLQNHDIEPIYLKGTGNLMDNLYSNISDRMIGDICLNWSYRSLSVPMLFCTRAIRVETMV